MKGVYCKFRKSKTNPDVGHWYLLLTNPPPGMKPLIPCIDVRTGIPLFTKRSDRPLVERWRDEQVGPLLAPALDAKRETADDWYDRFATYREREVSTVDDDRRRWNRYVSPRIGAKDVTQVTADDIETIRDDLDAAVIAWEKAGKARGSGRLAYHSAANIWTVLTTAMSYASTRKGPRELRVREAQGNPCSGIRPPRNGPAKRRHWLRPGEISTYLACADVPSAWREAVAIGLYLHLRPGELQELRVKDVDLETGEVSISRAWDTVTGKVKAPKTVEGIRTVSIPDTLYPLLERLVTDAEPETLLAPVIGDTADDNRAHTFRTHLKRAGVGRTELYEDTMTHEKIDFRTIRDTGITWRFLAGHRSEAVQREAGHEQISTTLGYAKEVQDRQGRFGEPFPPLTALEPVWNLEPGHLKKAVKTGGIGCEGRDLNPYRSYPTGT